MILCRVCGTPPNKYRQAYQMDICRTCEIKEIQMDWVEQVLARWELRLYVIPGETPEQTCKRWLWEDHEALISASESIRTGLNHPYEGPWPGDADFGNGMIPYSRDWPEPDWSANDRPISEPTTGGDPEPFPTWSPTQAGSTDQRDPQPQLHGMDSGTPRLL